VVEAEWWAAVVAVPTRAHGHDGHRDAAGEPEDVVQRVRDLDDLGLGQKVVGSTTSTTSSAAPQSGLQ